MNWCYRLHCTTSMRFWVRVRGAPFEKYGLKTAAVLIGRNRKEMLSVFHYYLYLVQRVTKLVV